MGLLQDVISESRKAVLLEQTTMSCISFLPSGFAPVKSALKKLGKIKTLWGLEVLEDVDVVKVTIEDSLSIDVQKEHWDNFVKLMGGGLNTSSETLDLSTYLLEGQEDDLESLRSTLRSSLARLVEIPQAKKMESMFEGWKAKFGPVRLSTPKSVMIKYPATDGQLDKLHRQLMKRMGKDKGQMEMLLDAILNQEPLNAFPVFSTFDWLYGGIAFSKYNGIGLEFQSGINMSFNTVQSITSPDQDVIDDFEENDVSVKADGKVVYPKTKYGSFVPYSFKRLQMVIDDSDNQGDRNAQAT